jgi:hypothetical protein
MLPLLLIGGAFLQTDYLYADAFTLTSSSFRPYTSRKVITVQTIARRCSSVSYSTSSLLLATADSNESRNDDDDSTASSTKDGEETAAANSAKTTHHVQQKKPSSSTSSSLLPLGYTFASVMNIAAAMSLIWGSCAVAKSSSTTATTAAAAKSLQSSVGPLLSSTYHYWDPTFTSGMLTYLLLGAGTCHVLSNLTKQHQVTTQLQQKQRQRLTMGTILFSIIGMFSMPGEAGYHYHHNQIKFTTSLVLCQLAKLITAAISFIGWEDTIPNGFGSSSSTRRKNILHEIISGIKTSWKTLRITESHPASFYRTCFIFVTLGNAIFNIPNLIFYLKEGVNCFSMPISLIISSIGRMSLLSVILFVLKEEHASRQMMIIGEGGDGEKDIEKKKEKVKKKKNGTEEASSMFVMLNMMVGLWSVGVGISQGFVEGVPFNLRRAADKFLFGLIFLNNGVLMQLTKMGWIKSRDAIDPDADPPLRIML